VFFAPSGELLSPLLGMDEHIVRVAQFLFVRLPYLSEPGKVHQFNASQDLHQQIVDFRLQFLREGLVKMGVLSIQYPRFPQIAAMRHDVGK
jgi:hypothetical protein